MIPPTTPPLSAGGTPFADPTVCADPSSPDCGRSALSASEREWLGCHRDTAETGRGLG